MPLEDMGIIYAVFTGLVIREGFGKLVRIDLHLVSLDLIPCGSTEKENHE